MFKQMIAVVSLLLAVVITGCGGDEPATESESTPVVAVRTGQVQQQDFPVIMKLGGTLRGDRQTMIPAKVQSTVTEVLVKRSQAVKSGDLLVRLDPGGMTSQFRQAEAVYLNAEKQLKKMKSLYAAGAVAETQLDAVETDYKVAEANFDAARQAIEIRASFDGVVTDVYIRIGDEVSPGIPLVETANVAALRMILDVPTSRVGRLRVGQKVSLESPIEPGTMLTGEIFSIADAANKATRSFEVECRFADPADGFAPGTYILAKIEIATLKAAIVIPNDAILYRSGKALVYILASDTVELREVEVLAQGSEVSAVSGSMQPGQRVVVVGQKNLTPGSRVREADL